ncbi:MAG: alpha-ketoacid dehydrogenase subunit beta [Alphaproteobacteria bacterium]|nr:MAG: alpha-ketoacid dehydrogenase subunit beta [Alphaproteobacteria bacterium]
MPIMSYREAVTEALTIEMDRDETVIIMGEDIAGGAGGSSGVRDNQSGIWGTYPQFHAKYGENRFIDMPISEAAIVAAAAGAALTGMRPIAEIMFADFLGYCLDQVQNQAAKFRYMFGGTSRTPMVIRTAYGAGLSAAAQHSQCMYSQITHIPGMKVAVPSKPADAKGLMLTAIRDDDPVLFFEHKALFGIMGEVPEGDEGIPFGEAAMYREGDDCTVVAIGRMVHFAETAIDSLIGEGITCDLVDPRTTSPLDEETILESVEHTGRLVIVDESTPRCSVATDIAGIVASKGFHSLKAPIEIITSAHSPVPFSPVLETAYLPSVDDITAAIRKTQE